MSFRFNLVLLVGFSIIVALTGCGGPGPGITNPTPPPNGSFGNANLSGTYVFSVSGIDTNGAPYVAVGTFGANGKGGVSGGRLDINDASFTQPLPNAGVTGGNYTVGVDGRGTVNLTTNTPLGQITLDIVLQDSSHGLLTEFDGNATGSGTLDLQTANAKPAGSYAFSFTGSDSSGNLFATVGDFAMGSNGDISGLEDFNENGVPYANEALTGRVALGPSSTPATQLATPNFTLTYDVYAIDATHIKFIEMDTSATLAGDAYAQTSPTIPAGAFAFALDGSNSTSAGNASAAGGFLVTDGNGNITNASDVDLVNNSSASQSPVVFTGTYAAAGPGRYALALSNFQDGAQYVAYPFSGGLFLLQVDTGSLMTGAAYPHTSTTFSAAQGYGLNLTGVNPGTNVGGGIGFGGGGPVEVDNIAEFATSSGNNIKGVLDENYEPGGGPNYGIALSGQYSAPDSSGRGAISASVGNASNSSLNGGFKLTFYTTDGTSFPFIETDGGQVTAGIFVKQTPSSSSSAAVPANSHAFVMPQMARMHGALRKRK
jgi:hypothetical protein